MTDAATPAPEPAVSPEIQEALGKIRAEREANKKAAAEAATTEQARVDKLNAIKEKANAVVAPISEALANATDEQERQALIELEERTFAPFRDELEAAYREFSGQSAGESNPAGPGTTQIDASASAAAGAQG